MGYAELQCQICGVGFNISRCRTAREPPSAAWRNTANGVWDFVDVRAMSGVCPKSQGCLFAVKAQPGQVLGTTDDSESDDDYQPEEGRDEEGNDQDVEATEEESIDFNMDAEATALYTKFKSFFDPRTVPPPILVDSDDQTGQLTDDAEHIAGPGCISIHAFNGHYISADAMRGCTTLQCLVRKKPSWKPLHDSADFERKNNFFLSGLSDCAPRIDMACPIVFPARHGTEEANAANRVYNPEDAKTYSMPFHPTCLEIFKRATLDRYGEVDVDCLVQWWCLEGRYDEFRTFPRDPAVEKHQQWDHNPGDEWLAANPCLVPGLEEIFAAAQDQEGIQLDYVIRWREAPPSDDVFSRLPAEMRLMMMLLLDSQDLANLRLASRTFRAVPQAVFRNLILRESPWIYEAWSSLPLSFWATTTATELTTNARKVAVERARLREALRLLQEEVRESDDPSLHEGAMEAINRKTATMPYAVDVPHPPRPVTLLKRDTDWYILLCLLARHRGVLPGLRNRQRIWRDCHHVLELIDEYRRQGRIFPKREDDEVEKARCASDMLIEKTRRWNMYCAAGKPGPYIPEEWD